VAFFFPPKDKAPQSEALTVKKVGLLSYRFPNHACGNRMIGSLINQDEGAGFLRLAK
jgi:hypothetical protein